MRGRGSSQLALKPYCFTVYGAHQFRYWLLAESGESGHKSYALRDVRFGDAFLGLPETSRGGHDVAETNCTASSCITVRQRFNGQMYAAFRCSEMKPGDQGKEIESELKWRN